MDSFIRVQVSQFDGDGKVRHRDYGRALTIDSADLHAGYGRPAFGKLTKTFSDAEANIVPRYHLFTVIRRFHASL